MRVLLEKAVSIIAERGTNDENRESEERVTTHPKDRDRWRRQNEEAKQQIRKRSTESERKDDDVYNVQESNLRKVQRLIYGKRKLTEQITKKKTWFQFQVYCLLDPKILRKPLQRANKP